MINNNCNTNRILVTYPKANTPGGLAGAAEFAGCDPPEKLNTGPLPAVLFAGAVLVAKLNPPPGAPPRGAGLLAGVLKLNPVLGAGGADAWNKMVYNSLLTNMPRRKH